MVLSQNKNQKGGSCGMGGVCSIQMGGRKKSKSKSKHSHKKHGGGCGCAGSTNVKQFGGRTKKRHSKKRHSKKH